MADDSKVQQLKTDKKEAKKGYIHAVGRRKEAVARVRLYSEIKTGVVWGENSIKKGEIYVNGKPIENYFPLAVQQIVYKEPLKITNALHRYAITIKVVGGGNSGQLDAVVHGISRALEKADLSYRPILKKREFLTRDARVRQRRKGGMGGKSRRKKQSPKR